MTVTDLLNEDDWLLLVTRVFVIVRDGVVFGVVLFKVIGLGWGGFGGAGEDLVIVTLPGTLIEEVLAALGRVEVVCFITGGDCEVCGTLTEVG